MRDWHWRWRRARRWVGCSEHLDRLGMLDRFSVLSCANDDVPAKPDPEVYRLAVDRLGVAPHEATAFEDSPNGIAAARAAGLRCIAVPNWMTEGTRSLGRRRRSPQLRRPRRRSARRRCWIVSLPAMAFPQRRLRRLRRTPALRRMTAETRRVRRRPDRSALRTRRDRRAAADRVAAGRGAAHA